MSPLPPPSGGISTWTLCIIDYIKRNNIKEIKHINTAIKFRKITDLSPIFRIFTGVLNSSILLIQFMLALFFFRPNVIHLGSSASLALFKDYCILFLANLFRIKVIFHWHFGRIPHLYAIKNWEWYILCEVIKSAHKSIVIDMQSLEVLKNKFAEKLIYIPNPISKELQTYALEVKQSAIRNENQVLFVGHVIYTKGIYDLVNACSINVYVQQLRIIGPCIESTKNQLLTLFNNSNSVGQIIFEGVKSHSEVIDALKIATVLVLPSFSEGFPFIILEAMACGCPIIATKVGAIPDILLIGTDKPCGIGIQINNLSELNDSIVKIISDSRFRHDIILRAKKRVLDFNIEKVFPQYYSQWYT